MIITVQLFYPVQLMNEKEFVSLISKITIADIHT